MESQLKKIIKEISEERGYVLKTYSDDFILQIINNDKVMFIYGYKFPNNNASIEQICDDKAGLSSLLEYYNIPHIDHFYFYSKDPNAENFDDATWKKIYSLFNKYKKVVCKSNKGTGGRSVYKAETIEELKKAVEKIFNKEKSVCISPYHEIKEEYRVVVINKKVIYIFKKVRPVVIGNGKDTICNLINQAEIKNLDCDQFDLNFIPEKGDLIQLTWKHNLGQGSKPELITDQTMIDRITVIADNCARKLDLNFVSIDVIDDGELKVLEINSGVMIENFSKFSKEYYYLSKKAIERAIDEYFK